MSDHTHDSHHDVAHFNHHIRVCIGVFLALMVLTVVTVLVSRVHLGTAGNVAVALFIATGKALLVACYFMHLISEKKIIYRVLIFTFFFAAGLVFLTLWAYQDHYF